MKIVYHLRIFDLNKYYLLQHDVFLHERVLTFIIKKNYTPK